jgi:very-short-patch-repair endonuclease
LPEVLLWQRLRGNQAGVKLRRQHPIGPYVVDFYCSVRKIVIEIDGEAHDRGNRPARDSERDRYLEANGYRLVRVAAADVLRDSAGVANSIAALVTSPLHQPSGGPPPHAGEDFNA